MSWSLRSIGLALLLLGLLAVRLWSPTAPEDAWEFIHAFEFGAEQCRALRESRETTIFTCPESLEDTVTAGEVAKRYNLELALVCRVNGLVDDCAGHRIAPGESLILPLSRRKSDLLEPSSAGPGE